MRMGVVLSAYVASGDVNALINMTETETFRYRYLKINSSTINNIFPRKILCFFQRHIQNQVQVILLACIEICHFYPILSTVYVFPGHSVYVYLPVGRLSV